MILQDRLGVRGASRAGLCIKIKITPKEEHMATLPQTSDQNNVQFQPPAQAPEPQPLVVAPTRRPRTAYGIQAWIASISLAVIAIIAITWTIELVRIQQDLHDTSVIIQTQAKTIAEALKTMFSQMGGS